MGTPKRPPSDGSVLALPGFLDFHATHNQDFPFALLVPETGSEIRSISFLEFADATHRIAHLMRPNLGETRGEVVVVLVHCDTILYLALVVGLIRAGFVPFLMSPRNTVPAIVNLIEKSSCHRIITQSPFHPLVTSIREVLSPKGHALHVDDIPDIYAVFPTLKGAPAMPVSPYPPPSKHDTNDDIALILHSSGSTGLPKPVPQKHINVLEWSLSSVIASAVDLGVVWGSMALPTFHIMGLCLQLYAPLVGGYPVALHYPRAPLPPLAPTAQNVIHACKLAGVSGIPMVPTFLEICAQNDDDVRYLASMKLVMFGGGPLSQKTGDKLAMAGVKFSPVYGSTEGGVSTAVFDVDYSARPDADVKSKEDWAWLSFMESVKPRWIPQGDGTYELQLLTCETHRPAVENIPDAKGYATNDLFIPHPTKKGLWRIIGRTDDVIILASGENVVPIPQEGHMTSSPLVNGAVMFGHGKNQCGMLVEPSPQFLIDPSDDMLVASFRDKIWRVVEEANHATPAFARVFKEMIIVADPARPLPRAGKGTVMRKHALVLYAVEIDELYDTVREGGDVKVVHPPETWSLEDVKTWLVELCTSLNGGEAVSPTVNLFDQGFDSLHATFLRNHIAGTLQSNTDEHTRKAAQIIPQNIVYQHPTISKLATAIVTLVAPHSATKANDRLRHIVDLIDKYSADIPIPRYTAKLLEGPVVVLLTGSTGNVGSHVLASLLADPRIGKVYALNRASAGTEDRQRVSFVERGLLQSLLDDEKLIQLVGDPNESELGLEHSIFSEVVESTTHIIHNAWRVNFNTPLAVFEPQISAARKLLDVCATSPRPIRLLFVSSISAAQNWPISRGAVPEEPLADPRQTSVSGYGASKFVVENILAKAARQGVPCTSLRVGQVCGARTSGAWTTSEWVPLMLKSSVALGALPSLEGGVSWIPMDALANAMVDFVATSEPLPPLLNVVHPHRASGASLVATFNACLDAPLPIVSGAEWLSKLECAAEGASNADITSIPAVRLLAFFRDAMASAEHARSIKGAVTEVGGHAVFETEKLQRLCPAIADLRPLDERDVKAWVAYWRARGFLSS